MTSYHALSSCYSHATFLPKRQKGHLFGYLFGYLNGYLDGYSVGPAVYCGQVRLLLEMLRVEPWLRFPLTLQFTSSGHSALRNGAPPPPPHVAVLVAPLEVTCIDHCCLASTSFCCKA